ncbi:uncharacterized protein N7477_009568 [Penicillium maclennaniae]|uniref:uncharacterized protein n=1 Tax=Penicillium maclennaniae TaxID=1343394 RepID=UPI00254259B5|nr:uncharacterized protein N7477_009568 [Penicillium maclennaniae]KAJ5661952.1 hypothetical protein N7477_009568 [Penicillium maclennaniae]
MASALRRLIPARVANTGSQQRDHHANERTFLSWTRAGLGFAAMALALDRLDAIDKLLTSKLGSALMVPQHAGAPALHEEKTAVKDAKQVPGPKHSQLQTMGPRMVSDAFSATRLCQLLGVWCLGYGFFRYWSMRRYLMIGQFVPAFWGPVFMTVGSFGAFMTLGLHMERRHAPQS